MASASHEQTAIIEKPKRNLLFGGLFSRLIDAGEPVSAKGFDAPASLSRSLEQLELELEEMSTRAEARLRESDSKRSKPSGLGTGPAGADNRERLLEEREVARRALEGNITRLHEQLATCIDRDHMERLRRLLLVHAFDPPQRLGASIEERIERSVLTYLFLRSAEQAWNRFERLVERSGLVWPVQEGLSKTAASEELDRLRERHREEIRAAFLGASPRQIADAIQGDVKAWVYSYPDKHSYLWLQTALRGVAAALCAQYFAAALELWMWRSPELDRDLVASLDEKLEPAREALRGGVRRLAEAMDVSARIDDVCERAIPSMVWSRILPRLDWGKVDQAAPPISVLAKGLSRLDPVCGMSLTAERVAERAERAGETLYFCSRSCRERFEANPS